jgi:hypothetical protein
MEKSEKLFPLCYKCAVDQNQVCEHSKNERQFIETWTTDEVNKALEIGYIITKIYEVWHFEDLFSNQQICLKIMLIIYENKIRKLKT